MEKKSKCLKPPSRSSDHARHPEKIVQKHVLRKYPDPDPNSDGC
jgi:hypothetical protein